MIACAMQRAFVICSLIGMTGSGPCTPNLMQDRPATVGVPAGTASGDYAVNIIATAAVPGSCATGVCASGVVAGTIELEVRR
jgi:hypothetical protein